MRVPNPLQTTFSPGTRRRLVRYLMLIILLQVVNEIWSGAWRVHTGEQFPLYYLVYPLQHLAVPIAYWSLSAGLALLNWRSPSPWSLRALLAVYLFALVQMSANHKFLIATVLAFLALDGEESGEGNTPSLALVALQLDIVYGAAGLQKIYEDFSTGDSLTNLLWNLRDQGRQVILSDALLEALLAHPWLASTLATAAVLLQLGLPLLFRRWPRLALWCAVSFHLAMALVIPGIWVFSLTMVALAQVACARLGPL